MGSDVLEELKVLIDAEIGPLKKELNSALKETKTVAKGIDKQANSIKNSFKKISGSLKGLLVIGTLIKISSEAISLASAIEEVENVVNASFGNMRHHVDDFAKDSIRQFGLSELTAKKTASTYMAMSKGMGFIGKDAAIMAVNVAKMTGDLASFYNVSQEVADTALKSIWTGETESLKKFGVVMTQANLEQHALKKGMQGNIQALSQQEQLLLRYDYVMNSLSIAQGDFSRTSGGWANQVRILSEQFKQLLATIGSGLINVLLPIVKLLNYLLSQFVALANLIRGVFSKIFSSGKNADKITKPMGVISDSLSEIGTDGSNSMNKLGKATEKAGKQARGALASFDELNVLTSNSDVAAGSIQPNTGGLSSIPIQEIGVSTDKAEKNLDTIVDKAVGIFGKIKGYAKLKSGGLWQEFKTNAANNLNETKAIADKVWKDLKSLGSPLYNWASNQLPDMINSRLTLAEKRVNGAWRTINNMGKGLWDNFVFPVGKSWIDNILPVASDIYVKINEFKSLFVDEFYNLFNEVWSEGVNPVLSLLSEVFNDVLVSISEAYAEYGEPIFQGLMELLKNIFDVLHTLWNELLQPVLGILIRLLSKLWHEILKPVFKFVLEALGSISVTVLDFMNKYVKPLIDFLIRTVGPVFVEVFKFIETIVGGAISTIGNLIGDIMKILKGVIKFITGVFSGDWGKAWEGVKEIFGGIWEAIKDTVSGFWSFITTIFSKGGEIFVGIVDGVANIFRKIVNGLLDGINWVIAQPFKGINGILNWIKDISVLGIKPFDGLWGYDPIPVPQIPYLDVGTNYVARDGLAYIHEGEAVIPKKYNPAMNGNNEQIELLQEQNKLLRALLNKDNNVYLDGDELYKSNKKKQDEQSDRFGYAY